MNSNQKSKLLKTTKYILTIVLSVLAITIIVKAGSLTQSSTPTAKFYTLTDIYDRLITNATAVEGSHEFAPTASPAGTFKTLTQIYDAIPSIVANTIKLGTSYLGVAGTLTPEGAGTAGVVDLFDGKTANLTGDWTLDTGTLNLACNTSTFNAIANLVPTAYDGSGNGSNRWCMTDSGDAVAANILSGKTAWVDGQAVSGSMATQTLSAANDTVSAGYYVATTLSAVDTDLTAANINSGTVIFGVTGTLSGAELRTGQTACYNAAGTAITCTGTGQDGDIYGTSKSYTDPGCGGCTSCTTGTVLDNQTGLCWQEDDQATMLWEDALTYCNNLKLCADDSWTTGSCPGAVTHQDWRLPTLAEGNTMSDYSCDSSAPAHCYGAFRNNALDWSTTNLGYFWLSTTRADGTTSAYALSPSGGYISNYTKNNVRNVRCVR